MADNQRQSRANAYSAVSAPGKVLLAGGYLVLDRAYTGLVFGLSARIHVVTQVTPTADGGESLAIVKSPQFIDAEWRYSTALLPDGAGVAVKQLERYDITYFILYQPVSFRHFRLLCHFPYLSPPTLTTTLPMEETKHVSRAHPHCPYSPY